MPVTNYYTIDGQMIGYKTAAGRRDFLTDALGSVTAEVDQTGATKTFDGRYKPYGGDLSTTGARGSYGWVGSWGYRGTGLSASSHYVRARHYSSIAAQWISIDRLWPYQRSYSYGDGRVTFSIDFFGNFPLQQASGQKKCKKYNKEEYPWDLDPCSKYPSGGCPNQVGKGKIDLKKFWEKNGRKDSDNTYCNPGSIPGGILDKRIKFLQDKIDAGCEKNHWSEAPSPTKNLGKNPVDWATTWPCWDNLGDGSFATCSIKCDGNWDSLQKMGKDWGHGGAKDGIGCLGYCLMMHENEHCDQLMNNPTISPCLAEKAAYKKEIECLKDLLKMRGGF